MDSGHMSEVVQHLRRTVLRQDGAGLTDRQLLECYVSQREEAAFAALVHRHGPMVWAVCHRVLRNHHDTEDAFQATFLVLVRKAPSVLPREMLANWLYGVAQQTAWKARSVATRKALREKQVATMPEPEAAEENRWQDLHDVLDQEVALLPSKYRVAVVLCDLEGRTRQEAARQLGWPEGTVASRLARARAMLAKRLARHGQSLTGGALAAALTEKAASACAPSSLVSAIIKAAGLVAAGQRVTTAVIPTKVAALTEGVVRTMFLSRLKSVAVVLLVVGLLGSGVGVVSYRALGGTRNGPGTAKAFGNDELSKGMAFSDRTSLDPAPPEGEPTSEQLGEAMKVFARLGATYQMARLDPDPHWRKMHLFIMPQGTTDANLKKMPNVPFRFALFLFATKVTDAGLKELKNLDQLASLNLGYTQVTAAGLKELAALQNLHLLDLTGVRVTEAEFKELGNLKELTYLDLVGTKVTGAGLKELKDLKHLTSLKLWGTEVTDAGLKEIKDLKHLTLLDLGYTKITDAGLKELKDLEHLTTLVLNGTQITDAGLKELKGLEQLATLNLMETKVSDAGLKELEDLKRLTSLYLAGSQVTATGLKELEHLKQLTTLGLDATQVTPNGLKELRDLKQLTELQTSGTKATDVKLKELKVLKQLTTLMLPDTNMTDAELKELQEALPQCKIFHRGKFGDVSQ